VDRRDCACRAIRIYALGERSGARSPVDIGREFYRSLALKKASVGNRTRSRSNNEYRSRGNANARALSLSLSLALSLSLSHSQIIALPKLVFGRMVDRLGKRFVYLLLRYHANVDGGRWSARMENASDQFVINFPSSFAAPASLLGNYARVS